MASPMISTGDRGDNFMASPMNSTRDREEMRLDESLNRALSVAPKFH